MDDKYVDERYKAKGQELEKLAELSLSRPELFKRKTFIDDADALAKVGIYIPNKKSFGVGYLKLWASDFIVEEISKDSEVYNVSRENILNKNTVVETSPTFYATLVKCNIPTIEVVKDISKQLDCDINSIQYAGIKDKDAISSQRISFRNLDINKIKEIKSSHFFLKDVVGGKGVIERGGIKGNRFTILIRTEKSFFEPEAFQNFTNQLAKVKENGFYNFFYLQRFAVPRLINFHWAILILKGRYEEAIKSFITDQSERESLYFQELRQEAKKKWGDWNKVKEVFDSFPMTFANELKVLNHLQQNHTDFTGALSKIPEQIALWTYSISSFFFNRKISQYLRENKEPPSKLPSFLSFRKESWNVYRNFAEEFDIFPPQLDNLKVFPFLQFQPKEIFTKEKVVFHDVRVIDEGVILSFSLAKGDYATSFLSHILNIASSKVPEGIKDTPIDLKSAIGETPIQETINFFAGNNTSKAENLFDLINSKK